MRPEIRIITMDLKQRFESKINKNGPNGCWEWQAGCFGGTGYGSIKINGRNMEQCGELLFAYNTGKVAKCVQTKNKEHYHSDYSVETMVRKKQAKWVNLTPRALLKAMLEMNEDYNDLRLKEWVKHIKRVLRTLP